MSEILEYLKACPYNLDFKLELNVNGDTANFGEKDPKVTIDISLNDLEALLRSATTLSALRDEGRLEFKGDQSLVIKVHRFFEGIKLPN